MVPHSWIKGFLDLFRVAENIKSLLVNSMEKWKVMLRSGNFEIGAVVTADVVGLHPSILHEERLRALKEVLDRREEKKISTGDLVKMVEVVVCVRYIFTSLFCISKREHFRNKKKCFLFYFESSSRFWDNQILTF